MTIDKENIQFTIRHCHKSLPIAYDVSGWVRQARDHPAYRVVPQVLSESKRYAHAHVSTVRIYTHTCRYICVYIRMYSTCVCLTVQIYTGTVRTYTYTVKESLCSSYTPLSVCTVQMY